jgi:hypothetical protein
VLLRDSYSVRDGARPVDELLPGSYQSQDTPSERLGSALRVNVREIEKQGRQPPAHRHSICVDADASALIDKLRNYARVDVPKWL